MTTKGNKVVHRGQAAPKSPFLQYLLILNWVEGSMVDQVSQMGWAGVVIEDDMRKNVCESTRWCQENVYKAEKWNVHNMKESGTQMKL